MLRLLKNFGTALELVWASVIPVPLAQYFVIRNYVCSLTCPIFRARIAPFPEFQRGMGVTSGTSESGIWNFREDAGAGPISKIKRLNSRKSTKLSRNYHFNPPLFHNIARLVGSNVKPICVSRFPILSRN